MKEFVEQIGIAASRERVWSVMADLEHWPEWTPSIKRIETLEWATTGIGSRFRVEQPRLRPAEFTTTDWRPGHGFTWEAAAPGVRSIASHCIEAHAEGSQVTLRLRFEGWFSYPAALVFGGLVRRYLRLEAEGLKARSEG
jgi:uncharacterized protein YndB with AHSA1/START domain